MRGDAVDGESELTRAAARARHLAAFARRFEDEPELRLARLGFDAFARAERADLLVGVQEHRDVGAREVAAHGQRVQGVHEDDEAPLHVARARSDSPGRLVRIDAEGLERRVRLEDRVEVTQQQEASRGLGRRRRAALRHDHRADARVLAVGIFERCARLDLHREAEPRELRSDERRECF
ncbi:MAG TPA: hypothetical protein VKF60_09515 [Myxococcota bacterium]|nr:hypothetical protein [Myxococcota bacterium]